MQPQTRRAPSLLALLVAASAIPLSAQTYGSPYFNNAAPSRYWNLAAFTEAPPGQFGDVGRNSIIGPGIVGFDAEVHKQFRMPYKEGHVLQFRFEAFNALNHPNWQMPTLNILSGAAQPGMPATAAHRASEFFQQRPPTCARSNWVLVFVLISIARK